ncbi:RHS repeat-associated core domain-containing protein [uncultured Desulfuromonas sp.]|uniref:RHS repeat domain-containing protein n=1 Tax=uncultured Desulfuromonas sp. TaxID=181013 RepID=UPI002AAA689B|nr:RHS repeat-associated core domain-containing protein [uncultured Desulfuromonas sp.]
MQYQYDANGNTTQKTANGQTTTYDYNSRNRLSRVHLPDGRLVSYRYDPFGRRISKTVAGVTTCYTYSDEGLAAEYDANGTWQKSYGWKPDGLWGTDPVYQRTATGLYYYHNDHLGTPQRLSDESGTIAWSAGYTAFGNATIDPILSSIDNNLRFPGQYFDQETGLHYNYQRFYDPSTGRYTQIDPVGFFAGDVNQYRYGFNTPNYWIDPTGEFVFVGAAMLIYGAIELALSIYDVYDMLSTLADPCESGISKASAVGFFLLGAVLPGGGYGAVDDIAKAASKKLPRYHGPKPKYHVNPQHVPGRGLKPGKTPLPKDAESVFKNAVPNDPKEPTAWFGKNADGQIYRFSTGNDGTAHFSGIHGVGDGTRNLTDYAKQRLGDN